VTLRDRKMWAARAPASLTVLPVGPVDGQGKPVTIAGSKWLDRRRLSSQHGHTSGGFDAGSFAIYWGLDGQVGNPISQRDDFSITRELRQKLRL